MHPQRQSNTHSKSAALLAAEAAFAPPRHTTEQLPARDAPVVTVARAKRTAASADLQAVAAKPVEATAPSDATPSNHPQLSAPRARKVFLLKPANPGLDALASELSPLRDMRVGAFSASQGTDGSGGRPLDLAKGTPGPVPTPTPTPTRASTLKPMRKAKRNAPLPVTLLFSAMPFPPNPAGARPQQDALASRAYVRGAPPVLESARLAASLAEIEPVFAAIQAAHCFELADPQTKARWDGLSKALDQLAAELRAMSLTPVAPGLISPMDLRPWRR